MITWICAILSFILVQVHSITSLSMSRRWRLENAYVPIDIPSEFDRRLPERKQPERELLLVQRRQAYPSSAYQQPFSLEAHLLPHSTEETSIDNRLYYYVL